MNFWFSLDLRIPPCITVTNKHIPNDGYVFLCVLVVIWVCVCERASEPHGVCLAEVTPSESSVSVKQVPLYFAVI